MALTQINPQEKKKKPSKLETFANVMKIGGSLASMGKDTYDIFKKKPGEE
jgi:hypothetical protein